MIRRFLRFLCIGVSVIFVSGCSKEDGNRLAVHPIRGKCQVAGRPAVGARIVLIPIPSGRGQAASGVVGADGTFQLTTYVKDDGAAEGAYAVTITWPDPRHLNGDGTDDGADRLRGVYRNPTKPFRRVTIQKGQHELPSFDIK